MTKRVLGIFVVGGWIAIGIIACASTTPAQPGSANIDVPKMDAAIATAPADAGPPKSYSEDASGLYQSGMDMMRNKRLDDAAATFNDVRTRYKYSRYATLAELRIADIAFAQQDYTNATRLYRQWLHDHPSNGDKEMVVARTEASACMAELRKVCPAAENYDAGL